MRLLPVLALLCACGCTHHQLRWNAVKQTQTLTSIYQQQVLDNLALFSEDPHAVPHFAVPSSGGADVTDSSSFSAAPLVDFRSVVGISADRSMRESWTMQPVTDPDKLRRMRCAFQRAVGYPYAPCAKCCDLRKEFLGKKDTVIKLFDDEGKVAIDPFTGKPYEGTVFLDKRQPRDKDTSRPKGDKVRVYVPVVTDPNKLHWGTQLVRRQVYDRDDNPLPQFVYVAEEIHGRLTELRFPNFDCNDCCEVQSCWFEVFGAAAIPRQLGKYTGRHGNTIVSVPPSGRGELGKLVLEILEYAIKEPPVKPTVLKEVTLYLDQFGKPSNKEDAYQVVKTQIPLDKDNIAAEKGKVIKITTPTQKLGVLGFNPDLLGRIQELADSLGIDRETLDKQATKEGFVLRELADQAQAVVVEEDTRASAAATEVLESLPIFQPPPSPRIDLRELELNRQLILGR